MQVETLYSVGKGKKDRFNKKLFDYLIKNSSIPDGIQYLITTSIISDGVNIHNKDIEKIIIVDVKNWWVKRQYIARFREGVDNVYDLINSNGKEKLNWFYLEEEKTKRIEVFKQHLISFKQLKNNRLEFGDKIGYGKKINMIPLPESNDFIYFDEDTNEFYLSDEKIGLSIIDDLNGIMYNDHRKAREFYEKIAGFKVIQIGVDKLLPNKNESSELSNDEKNYVLNHFQRIFTVYVNKNHPEHPLRKNIHPSLLDDSSFDQDGFFKNNQKFFSYNNQLIHNLLKKVFELSLYRYPASLIFKLIELRLNKKHSTARKIERAFYYFFRMEALNRLNIIVDDKDAFIRFAQTKSDYKLLISHFNYKIGKNKIDYTRMSEELKEYNTQEILDAISGLYKITSKYSGIIYVSDYYPIGNDGEEIIENYGILSDNDFFDYNNVPYYMLKRDLTDWSDKQKFQWSKSEEEKLAHLRSRIKF